MTVLAEYKHYLCCVTRAFGGGRGKMTTGTSTDAPWSAWSAAAAAAQLKLVGMLCFAE